MVARSTKQRLTAQRRATIWLEIDTSIANILVYFAAQVGSFDKLQRAQNNLTWVILSAVYHRTDVILIPVLKSLHRFPVPHASTVGSLHTKSRRRSIYQLQPQIRHAVVSGFQCTSSYCANHTHWTGGTRAFSVAAPIIWNAHVQLFDSCMMYQFLRNRS